MADELKKVSLAGLSALGLNLTSEIEGAPVKAAKKTNMTNAFQLTIVRDGKDTSFFAGAKTIDEGLIVQNGAGELVVGPGFELAVINGATWARNKSRSGIKIQAVD